MKKELPLYINIIFKYSNEKNILSIILWKQKGYIENTATNILPKVVRISF
jgi:hypothetical protein